MGTVVSGVGPIGLGGGLAFGPRGKARRSGGFEVGCTEFVASGTFPPACPLIDLKKPTRVLGECWVWAFGQVVVRKGSQLGGVGN